IPRTPIVPFMLASQPGAAIVNCHGSLSVIVGAAVSFGASSSEPAPTRPMIANTAPARKSNFILMSRLYCPRRPNPRKINCPLFGYVSLVSVFLVRFVATDLSAIVRCLAQCVYRTLGLWAGVGLTMDD